jgi:osmotically-inducible protein OsmY
MFKMTKFVFVLAIISQLTACVTAVVGGAALGGSMIADRRTSGIYIEDENIEIKASSKIQKNLADESHVNVTSYNRIVLLSGEVTNAADKAKAETLVKTIPNIRSITNEIAVMEKSTFSDRTNDVYVTSMVKGNFLTANKFSVNHVKVVAERSVVYLMGLVTQKEADDAVQIARTTEGVAKVVKLFEYLP